MVVHVLQKCGAVACGHCTCMEGLGETCSHAVLAGINHKEKERSRVPNQWLVTRSIKKVPYLELANIESKRFHNWGLLT